jgi:hypothetical protein
MKDQKHSHGEEQSHERKSQHPEHSTEQSQESQHGHESNKASHKASHQSQSKQSDMKKGFKFEDLNHEKLEEFHQQLEQDEALKQRFQQSPEEVLREHGIEIPEGYKASYDATYQKEADGSNIGTYGYRIGNMNFSK